MRWFKHITTTRLDEKIARFEAQTGLEGYGFWWRILEIVAESMNGSTDKTWMNLPLKTWCSLCGLRPQKFNRLARLLEDCGVVNLQTELDNVYVNIPNLLKYRDEYSQRKKKIHNNIGTLSRHSPDQDTDIDTETEKEKYNYISSEPEKNPGSEFLIDPDLRKCLADTLNFKELAEENTKNERYWDSQIAAYEEPYNWFHLDAEIRKADAWCEANPQRRPRDKKRFLANWFAKALERGRKNVQTHKKGY